MLSYLLAQWLTAKEEEEASLFEKPDYMRGFLGGAINVATLLSMSDSCV